MRSTNETLSCKSKLSRVESQIWILRHCSIFILTWLMSTLVGYAVCETRSDKAASRSLRYCIALNGTASGGNLYLVERPQGFTPNYVTVKTSPGDPAEYVVDQLASELRTSGRIARGAEAEGRILKGLPLVLGFHAFAGTETSLGVPPPPLFPSGSYDSKANQVTLRWINPRDGYNFPLCDFNEMPANATECLVNMKGRNPQAPFLVIGIRNGVPSNFAVINVSRNAQEELECLPFYNGVMPNWSSWSTSSKPGDAQFEQGTKAGVDLVEHQRLPIKINAPDNKPFYQLIKTSEANVQAGVWRKFLGLTPGHTYRFFARLNTLAMGYANGEWSYSLRAAHNAAGGADFTSDQLSGKAPLPDGSLGPGAARIAEYGPRKTTEGQWIQHATGDKNSGVKDITLPDGVDTITVWVRHSGADSSGVGIDWVKLEDVTAAAEARSAR